MKRVLLLIALCATVSTVCADSKLQMPVPGLTLYIGSPASPVKKLPKNQLIQILVRHNNDQDKLNAKLSEAGITDRVTVSVMNSESALPYPDNFLNNIIILTPQYPPKKEILRVLAPGGKAKLPDGKIISKAYPEKMDDWPQWQHGLDNVVVSKDKLIGPPRHLQWLQNPPWGRMHNDLEVPAPVSTVLTSNGIIYYDTDTGRPESPDLPDHFFLFARNAFNGTLLWKRPLPNWYKGEEYRRGNPSIVIQRRMACDGNFLYLTESDQAPVLKLDAKTGKVLQTYMNTENAMEIIPAGKFIYVVVWERLKEKVFLGYSRRMGYISHWLPPDTPKDKLQGNNIIKNYMEKVKTKLLKLDAASGKVLWTKADADSSHIFPQALAIDTTGIYYKIPEYLVKINPDSGKTEWKSKIGMPISQYIKVASEKRNNWTRFLHMTTDTPWYMNTMFVGKCILYRDIILTTTYNLLYAVSKTSGKILWNCTSWEGFFLPADIIPIGDTVYIGSKQGNGGFIPVDLQTGKTAAEINIPRGGMIHHRCYRRIGSVDYLLSSKAGIEFHDLKTGKTSLNQWTRGSCLAGFIPGNGLIYMTPHPCACFTKVKMNGMLAYGADHGKSSDMGVPVPKQLKKGPAFGKAAENRQTTATDWTGYRHDMKRSGSTPAVTGGKLKQVWKVSVDGTPASLAAVGDSLYVPVKNKHILYCLNIKSGETKWTFTAGGRIDSAPTVKYGFVVFGSADGWVYCLAEDSGALVWRYHPAPFERFAGAFGQLESAWPIHAAVVVLKNENINNGNPVVYMNAGRNSFLDGGIYLCAVDLATGKFLRKTILHGPYDKNGNPISEKQWQLNGVKNDILLSDGKYIYIKDDAFDLELRPVKDKGNPHIIATGLSMLDPYRHHRSLWIVGKITPYGPNTNYAGELLSVYGKKIYSFRAQNGMRNGGGSSQSPYGVGMFEIQKQNKDSSKKKKRAPWKKSALTAAKQHWRQNIKLITDSMILTGAGNSGNEVLFLAGSINPGTPEGLDKALYGRGNSLLQARSASDGKVIAEYKLNAPPVHDGMAAVCGKVFVPLKNGEILCLQSVNRP